MIDIIREASLNEGKYRLISENGRLLGMRLFSKEVMCGYMNEVLDMLDSLAVDGLLESMEYCSISFVDRYRYPLMVSETKCECGVCKDILM